MAKKCLECGKKKGFFARNYAGLDVKETSSHPFPEQIETLVLPGDNQKDFLCVECANKHRLVCKKHGEVQGRIEYGTELICQRCSEVQAYIMKWSYWGESQMLPCPLCGKQMERARLQMTLGGGDDVMSALRSSLVSYKTSTGGEQIEQKCDSCGQPFESVIAIQDGKIFHKWRYGSKYRPA